jgi:hypothetical protein
MDGNDECDSVPTKGTAPRDSSALIRFRLYLEDQSAKRMLLDKARFCDVRYGIAIIVIYLVQLYAQTQKIIEVTSTSRSYHIRSNHCDYS